MRIVEFGIAIQKKEWKKAWEIATSFWHGSETKQREVLFYMFLELLEKTGV